MEKLPMCRICLAKNVRMDVVVNRNLRELYEKLTDVPFVTEDRRPILACFFCCAKLKQCYRLLRQCLEAEELFAQMMNEDYEPNSIINQDHLEFSSGFIISPIMHISIVDVCQTESIAIKEELPAVYEGLDVIIEPKEEHLSDELEPDNLDNSYLDVAYRPLHHSESDLEDDVPLMEFKIEVEEVQEVSKKKRRATETERATVAKKPKLDTRRTKLENALTAAQTKEDKSGSKTPQIGKTSYNRDVCQRSFSENNAITRHIRVHTDEKPFMGDVCQRSFSRKGALSTHIRIHTGDKPYKCHVCQRSFSQNGHLTTHVRHHTGEKPYKCDLCQRGFNRKGDLSSHIRIHTGDKPYKCDVCQRSFNERNALTRHNLVHTGEKPFKCDVCQRSFSRKGDLSTHIRIHSGDKPYKCHVCQRSFRQNGTLTAHVRHHTGEKPYKCDLCQRSFNQKNNLTKHIRIHTGEKPFKCDVCQRSFIEKGTLTKHIRIHTGENMSAKKML